MLISLNTFHSDGKWKTWHDPRMEICIIYYL
jgi:hypothetical protein